MIPNRRRQRDAAHRDWRLLNFLKNSRKAESPAGNRIGVHVPRLPLSAFATSDCHDGRQQTLRQIGEPVGVPRVNALDGVHAKRAISGRTNKNTSSPGGLRFRQTAK